MNDELLNEIAKKNKEAVAARDADDITVFEDLIDEIESITNPDTGRTFYFVPPLGFRQMYDESDDHRVLVLHGKHDDRYFSITSPDRFAAVMLQIIDERLAERCWYSENADQPEAPGPLSVFYLERFSFTSLPDSTPKEKVALWSQDATNWSHLDEIDNTGILFWINRCLERSEHETAEYLMTYLFKRGGDATKRALRALEPATPTIRAIINAIRPSAEDEVRAILSMRDAAQGTADIRRAGRLAFKFLNSRRNEQYERFTFTTME